MHVSIYIYIYIQVFKYTYILYAFMRKYMHGCVMWKYTFVQLVFLKLMCYLSEDKVHLVFSIWRDVVPNRNIETRVKTFQIDSRAGGIRCK